jgi:hypothetical protein
LALELLIHSGSFTASGTLGPRAAAPVRAAVGAALATPPSTPQCDLGTDASAVEVAAPWSVADTASSSASMPSASMPSASMPTPRTPDRVQPPPSMPVQSSPAPRAAQHRPTSCPARRLNAARRQAQRPARRLCVASGALVSVPVPRAAARAYRYRGGAVVSTCMQRAAARAYRYRRCSCATRPCSYAC